VAEVLHLFQRLFVQQRSWHKAQVLLVGALLCPGQRTVSRVLQVMGLDQDMSLPWSSHVWGLPFLSEMARNTSTMREF
jgi:hypothetical protein